MSVGFKAVQWSREKLIYDGILLAGVTLYILAFIGVSYRIESPKDLAAAIDVRIRAFGTCAFFMLTIILSIGPLARTARRSRNAEHGAGSPVLPARRLLVPRPDQRLLPGRLGLRLDHLLSLGDALQPGRAHEQDSGPLSGSSAAPEHKLDLGLDARR